MNTVQTFHMKVADVKKLVDDTIEQDNMPKPEPVQVVHVAPVKPTCEVCHDEAPANLLVAVQLDPKCYGRLQVLVDSIQNSPAPAEKTPEEAPTP